MAATQKTRRPEGEPLHPDFSEARPPSRGRGRETPAKLRRPRIEGARATGAPGDIRGGPRKTLEEIDSGDKSEGDTPLY